MPSYNKVIVMGNLTRDPDVRSVGVNAVKVCRFVLALNERRRDRNGALVDFPTFVEVDAWDKLAELCGQYLRKGRAALVEGRLQMDTWEKDGQKHQKLKIRAVTVKFMPEPAPNKSRLTGEFIPQEGDAFSEMDDVSQMF
ncbi:MAG: single-stranded DNA-binding protein [Kiritimatiellae bacterium]|nr:single-stranded DNA-binding protein [Kiritimatiellia bacterium]